LQRQLILPLRSIIAAASGLFLMAAAHGFAAAPLLPTKVENRAALEQLLGNSGMTIQWISFENNKRGNVDVSWKGKTLLLKGQQRSKDGAGQVMIDGHVVRINKSEFIFSGKILIENTPDAGRRCERDGEWKFAITQKRKYWRMREFEWCDQLTDYIDIYF
jgi:hypothetical protein